MEEQRKIKSGFYRVIKAVEASTVEKRGETEETHLKKPKKCFGI